MPELRLPVTPEFLAVLQAHHAKRIDRPSLAGMARDYILRTLREVEREERQDDAASRRERARLAALERKLELDRRATRRAEAAAERERLRVERASAMRWNDVPRADVTAEGFEG